MIIGAFITAILLGALKRDVSEKEANLGKWKGIPIGPKYKEGAGSKGDSFVSLI